jgi:hypothetical protein
VIGDDGEHDYHQKNSAYNKPERDIDHNELSARLADGGKQSEAGAPELLTQSCARVAGPHVGRVQMERPPPVVSQFDCGG